MADKISTRQAYGDALVALGRENQQIIVMDADLSKSTMTAGFKKEFPERFFNAGHRGSQYDGHGRGSGPLRQDGICQHFRDVRRRRAYEIIRNSIAYPKANVKTVRLTRESP